MANKYICDHARTPGLKCIEECCGAAYPHEHSVECDGTQCQYDSKLFIKCLPVNAYIQGMKSNHPEIEIDENALLSTDGLMQCFSPD